MIPAPLIATNVRISRGFRTRRSKIISGKAERDDAHHEGEQGAHRQAPVVQCQYGRHDGGDTGIQGDPDQHGEGVPGAGVAGEEVRGCPAVG
jgi:hypothetical protein